MSDPKGNNPPSYPPLDASGWIKRHRKVRDHHLVGHGLRVKPANPNIKKCLNKGEAWEDLIMMAQHSGGRQIDVGGDTVILNVGQLLASTRELASRWNWTRQTVRTWFVRLQKEKMIELNPPCNQQNNPLKGRGVKNPPNVATISNYSLYQVHVREITEYVKTAIKPTKQPVAQPTNNPLTTHQQPASNPKEVIKELKKNIRGGKGKKVGDQLFNVETGQPVNEERAQANEAIDLYNEMARKHGWTCCRTRVNRIPVMMRRLKEIEGLENFKLALSEIPKNDFLSGRKPSRDGGEPFRMDIERLMSTRSNLGDVLATLVDRAGLPGDHPKTIQDVNAHVASLDLAEQRELVRKHANGVYPPAILGSPAGNEACPMRQEVIEEFKLLERYDYLGRSR